MKARVDENPLKFCKCMRQVNAILAAYEPATPGHTGVYKNYAQLAGGCFWPLMRSNISRFIRCCNVCVVHKDSQDHSADKMVSHSKVNMPLEMIPTDSIGPLLRSQYENSFILVVLDHLGKLYLLFLLQEANAEQLYRILRNAFTQFLEFQRLLAVIMMFNVAVRSLCGWERVMTMLAMYCSEIHWFWDENPDKIGYAIRTSEHNVTEVTTSFKNYRNIALSGWVYDESNLSVVEHGTKLCDPSRNDDFGKLFADDRKRLEEDSKKSGAW
ncbi:hypothetical protein JTB14_021147 [Gonioctena quinquepunctata]|nr:hypothetical protein JTB14_021147 [Gonioctena quinquepunctata]